MKRALCLAVVAGALLFAAAPVDAHPMGNFSINHYAAITVGERTVRILYIVDMAEIPTFQELSNLGADPSGRLTRAQRRAYLPRKARDLARGISLRLGGRTVPLRLRAEDLLFPPGAGGLPTERIYLVLDGQRAPAPRSATTTLTYSDANFGGRAGWKEIVAGAGTGARIVRSSVPSVSRSAALTVYPTSVTSSPPQDTTASLTIASTMAPPMRATGQGRCAFCLPLLGTTPSTVIHGAEAPLFAGNGHWSVLAQGLTRVGTLAVYHGNGSAWGANRIDALSSLIGDKHISLVVLLLSLVVAFWFGAGHALSPGHGKTIVAAYLVGSRGTAWHAALLGLTVTATHTAGVFALGLVTLFLSHYILPDQLYPWLGFISGMLVASMGATLFVRRTRALRGARAGAAHLHGDHAHDHTHGHDHDHVHPHVHDDERAHPLVNSHAPTHAHAHDHAHGLPHHQHDHHGHDHGYDHEHGHSHRHDDGSVTHRHGFFGRPHTHAPIAQGLGSGIRIRSLVALGISGGLLPCPSALVVLLSAIAFHRIGFGIVLIVAFSFGLASTLTGIGILVVYGQRMVGRLRPGSRGSQAVPVVARAARVLPVFSAAVVALLGTVIAVGALQPGALPSLFTRL